QREAVFSSAPHCLVLAGPGTGKTRTLVNRIVYLASMEGVPADEILALTFTRKAAKVMVDRLSGYLGKESSAIAAGTFHHFGLHLLRENPEQAGIAPGFVLADENRQIQILRMAWERLGISSRNPEPKELRAMLGLFGMHRADPGKADLSSLKRELFEEYQRSLRREQAIDFDDILFLSRTLLQESPELLEKTRMRWSRVLVDEFQDTDALQYQLLKLLLAEKSSSFLVADDQQSIYSWRGADRRNLESYRQDYQPLEIVLHENYRNRERILSAASRLLNAGKGKARTLSSSATGKGDFHLESFDSEAKEAEFLISDIRQARLRDSSLLWNDIAILYPKHSIGEYLEGRLMSERIPAELVSGRALLDQDRIRRSVAMLRLLRNRNDEEAWEVLLRDRLGEGAFSLFREVSRSTGSSYLKALQAIRSQRDALRSLSRRWSDFQKGSADLTDDRFLEQAGQVFPDSLQLPGLLPEREIESGSRDSLLSAGDRLESLSRISWKLDQLIGQISNLRTGQKGKTLEQLLREVLLLFEDSQRDPLPGSPHDHEGLDELLREFRTLLVGGKRVGISSGDGTLDRVLADMLRQGMEPWYRRSITEGRKEENCLLLDFEKEQLSLETGSRSYPVRGEDPRILLFRLYQLWRSSEFRPLRDFVVFDLETTGLDTKTCEIIEIAGIRYEDGREVGRFESLVKCKSPVPPASTKIHGITDEMLLDAPALKEALRDFSRFAGERDLIAHNGSSYDFPIYQRTLAECGLERPRQSLFDTVILARSLFPKQRNSLEHLNERFGIEAKARHRALDDCRCLAEAFEQMQKLSLKELARRSGREALPALALSLILPPRKDTSQSEGDTRDLFRQGVRRLLSSGNELLDRMLGEDERTSMEEVLLKSSGLEKEAPELFRGRRSEEDRILSLVPRFDELFLGDSLASFLDFLALYQAADLAEGKDAVQLMTIHAAKGLEFRRVYIVGLEENVLPGYYALRSQDPEEVEEERRLLYVAMTRAAESLTLSRVAIRDGFQQDPSRFLESFNEVHQ
ncbi:MAG: UvrD-helicase domain-containing protein, partial [Candidatus Krumholzibacteria bacterium]|nr:UvrD-helicase domain-containing protein [Candidatus Krumholzibacteria bacterium]